MIDYLKKCQIGRPINKEVDILVYPFVSKGSLLEQLKLIATNPHMSRENILRWKLFYFYRTILALYRFQNLNQMAHLDVKPDNLVVLDNYDLSFIDVATARSCDQILTCNDKVGTVGYADPEFDNPIHMNGLIDIEKADIYSLGMTLRAIMFFQTPQ